jgi:hypothetical protein
LNSYPLTFDWRSGASLGEAAGFKAMFATAEARLAQS